MDATPKTVPIVVYIVILVFLLFMDYFVYWQNLRKLNAFKNSRKVRPNKFRFVIAWSIYSLFFCAPLIIMIWFVGKQFPTAFAWMMFLTFLFIAPAVYPYYTLARFKNRINGATKWGWFWRRTEIAFNEMDVSKTLRQQLGKILGIIVFHSISGVKILALGLDNQQVSDILSSSSEIE